MSAETTTPTPVERGGHALIPYTSGLLSAQDREDRARAVLEAALSDVEGIKAVLKGVLARRILAHEDWPDQTTDEQVRALIAHLTGADR